LTADHGEEFFEHGSWLHGGSLHEGVLHVPLAIRVAGLAPRRIADPVSTIDIAPTLIEALGLPPLPGLQGRSLLPAMRGEPLPERPSFAETLLTPGHERRIAVRLGGAQAAFRFGRDADPDAAPLAREHSPGLGEAERARLEQLVVAYLRRARAEGSRGHPVDLSPETIEKLRAWGYIQ
jgi:arylsulfatase A-like enzyme